MFAKLKGVVDEVEEDFVILDVNGVGYQVFVNGRTLDDLRGFSSSVSLFIETQVREDHIHLFGFLTKEEQNWFKTLTSVQGVGAKAGLAVLSAFSPQKLQMMIAAQDAQSLRAAEGVGPKLALRIVTELKDKVGNLKMAGEFIPSQKSQAQKILSDNAPSIDSDALSALINLGYGRGDAFSALMTAKSKANDNEQNNLSALIRLALKELSS